jgi:hypothetical protein
MRVDISRAPGQAPEPVVLLTPGELTTLRRAARIVADARSRLGHADVTAECTIGSADASLYELLRDIDPRARAIYLVTP